MDQFQFFNPKKLRSFLNTRKGETKFGQVLSCVNSLEEMAQHPARYVIFGVPEDIGIRANFGQPGAATTWRSFLSSFLNIQSNAYNRPENCLILGHIDCDKFMTEADRLLKETTEDTIYKIGEIVQLIDDLVAQLVRKIVAANKIPIIIGGGHNNAFGNIKGTSLALNKPVNILNIDAHTDLRNTDYRHSGNGFSYAKQQGYMNKYAMFGIHKNYTPQYIFDRYKPDEKVHFALYEDLMKMNQPAVLSAYHEETVFLDENYGLEIDCDVIEHFSSSAMTPSGFSIDFIRNFISISSHQNIHYLHLCEAAAHGNSQIGKALSYFVSDFMRGSN